MNIIRRIFDRSLYRNESPAISRHVAWLKSQLPTLRESDSVDRLRPFLLDYDGYLRQAAVEYCGKLALRGAVASLVERLNDWVPQVRAAARHAIDSVLPTAAPAELLAALPAIYGLLNAKREDHVAWVAAFERKVFEQVGAAPLVAALQGSNVQVSRAAFRLLATVDAMTPQALFALVVPASSDIVLTLRAFDYLEKSEQGFGEAELIRAFRSKTTPLRVRALRTLIARGCTNYVQEALFVRQSPLRAVATAYLAAQGADVPAIYKEALDMPDASPARMAICLTQLGALRQPACLDSIRPFLDHSSVVVRIRAAQAWFRLAPSEKDEVALWAMADPAPELRALAFQLVRKHGAYIPFEHVRLHLQAPEDRALLWWFAELDPWDWLGTAMSLAGSEAAEQEKLSGYLDLDEAWIRWARFSNRKPTGAQRGFLLPLLESGGLRSLRLAEDLRGALASVFERAGLPCRL